MTAPAAYTAETAPAEFIWTNAIGASNYIRVAITTSDANTETREFDAIDTKGRRFGARMRTWTEAREAVTENNPAYSNRISKWSGVRYFAGPHALRGGQLYGAMPNDQCFETIAERDAYIAKYFVEAEKCALKNKSCAK